MPTNWSPQRQNQIKAETLQRLEKLLDVAGCGTPWDEIAKHIRSAPIRVLRALIYRVERARDEAYREGELAGRGVGAS